MDWHLAASLISDARTSLKHKSPPDAPNPKNSLHAPLVNFNHAIPNTPSQVE
jgi:hypothetical protein